MSPVATSTNEQSDDALLKAADRLFYQRGVGGVSMAEIRDESGLSMRRLYQLYPSKSDLVATWLRYRHKAWMEGFVGEVDKRLGDGELAIDAIFSALAAWMTATGFRGCGFINTHAESNDLTHEHREIIRMHKRSLTDYLDRVTSNGDLLAVLVDGAIVQASIHAEAAPIESAGRAAMQFSANLSPTSPGRQAHEGGRP